MLRSGNLLMALTFFFSVPLNSLTEYSVMDGSILIHQPPPTHYNFKKKKGHQVANELISPLCPAAYGHHKPNVWTYLLRRIF